MIHLVIGGARSGKSRFAEQTATASGKQPVYIATAQAGDDEMAKRIAHHQSRRDGSWLLVEEPLSLATVLATEDASGRAILVDCLTLWLNNCLHANCLEYEKRRLLEQLPTMDADVVLVINDVGSGVVPLGELSRRFVDESGWLQQELAVLCSRVTLVTAGLPMTLKDEL